MNVPHHELREDEFLGTDRFRIRRRLGAGGMGVVYLAFDQLRNELVAVKTLRHVAPDAIYRLKREFRAHAELSHPQLVKLHELFCVDQRWFFTMEYVEGSNLLEYLAALCVDPGLSETEGDVWRSLPSGTAPHAVGTCGESAEDALPPPPRQSGGRACESTTWRGVLPPGQVNVIRQVMAQLVNGVCRLHAVGILHRDLKPTNVIVTRDARVVILDFGLALQLAPDVHGSTMAGMLVGTTAYMSPEQARGEELTFASDWYSVGAILYETLTGRTPFIGSPLQILADKQLLDPAQPSSITAGVPCELDNLCMQLLARLPTARPTGEEILRRLGAEHCETVSSRAAPAVQPPAGSHVASALVGRQRQLRELELALSDVEQGSTVVVSVEGESAVGKSALVRHFLQLAERHADTVVLAGRCHERESVPYKAFDSLVDMLSHYLLTRSSLEVETLLPRDTEPLVRVFPTLRRVGALAATRTKGREPPDRQELRDRAFLALREMLGRLGDRATLILHIDDMQWSDRDSISLLHDLLQPPNPPPLLLIVCRRMESESSAGLFESLAVNGSPSPDAFSVRRLTLEPLVKEDSRQLVRTLWNASIPPPETLTESIASSADGNPYFVELLVQYHCSAHAGAVARTPVAPRTLEEVLCEQFAALESPARRLLQVVAVAGCPLRYLEACRAAGLESGAGAVLASLRAARLIRTPDADDAPHVEIYHDRIRAAVLARLPVAECVQLHRQLAEALESSGVADTAAMAEHFAAAGEMGKGRNYYLRAAQDASDALAFDRAAELYRRAIELKHADSSELQVLQQKRAAALANAGRGAEAARHYAWAAEHAPEPAAFDLRRQAAMHYLFAGEVDQGLAILERVLAEQGLHLPSNPRHAVAQWLWWRMRLRIRGLRFHTTDEQRVPPDLLRRIDTCWSATAGLSVIDPLSAAVFQTRGLLWALQSGEPFRIARALCVEAAHVSLRGGKKRAQVEMLLERAETIACRLESPYVRGLTRLASGTAALSQGRWQAARQCCDEAETIFREQCTGVAWELDCAAAGAATALYDAGEIALLARCLPALRDRARRRGNLFALTAPSSMNLPSLAADQPERARQILDDCLRHWSDRRFYVQHFSALYDQIQTDLYRDDPATAWARIAERRGTVQRSLLMRVQLSRVFTYQTRARCALAMLRHVDDPRPLLRLARRDACRIQREGQHWTLPLAELLLAAVTAAQGRWPEAIELLEKAVVHFDKADMVLFAAVARWQLGRACGGTAGAELVDRANQWFCSQGVVRPQQLCRLYAPGFPSEVPHATAIR